MPTKKEKIDFKRGTASFKLLGKARIGDNAFSINQKSESGYVSNKVYFGVDCGKGNVVYAQMWGGYRPDANSTDPNVSNDIIHAHGAKADPANPKRVMDDYEVRHEVAWADRNNSKLIEEMGIGPSCFTYVGLYKDAKTNKLMTYKYLSQYDAIISFQQAYMDMPSEMREDLVLEVKGDISYRYYNGKIFYEKNITSIKRRFDVDEKDFGANFTQTCYTSRDSLGTPDKEKKILPIKMLVPQYVSKYQSEDVKAMIPLEYEMELDATAKAAGWIANAVKKSKGYCKLTVLGEFIESGSTEEFDIEDLNPKTRAALEMGIFDIKQVQAKVAIGGERTQRMLIKFISAVKDDSEEGLLVADFTDNVYTEKEMEALSEQFYSVVRAVDNGDTDSEGVAVEESETPISDDDVPFDLDPKSSDDDEPVDWLKNFGV